MRLARALVLTAVAFVAAGAHAEEEAGKSAPPAAAYRTKEPAFALGARVRGIWFTPAMLSPFLTTSTPMQNASLGLELIYRRLHYDVVTSMDFSFVSPADGNYLGSGHDPSLDTHYAEFKNLNFLSWDVSIIGHTWLTNWLELRYGAGVGLGVVLGDVWLTNDGAQCTAANAGDLSQCHPLGVDLTAANKEQQLAATQCDPNDINKYPCGAADASATPHRHVSADKPPVFPVVNILVGLNFRLHKHASLQLEVGFRDAIFFGLGVHYWF